MKPIHNNKEANDYIMYGWWAEPTSRQMCATLHVHIYTAECETHADK